MSSFIEKTKVVSSDAVRALMSSLYQAVGNKRYLHDLEQFLNGLEITPEVKQTLMYLSHDLNDLKHTSDRNSRNKHMPW